MQKRSRKLKVYLKSQRRTGGYVLVPEIRLCGKWLEENDFKIASQLDVKVSKGRINICISH